MKPKMTFSFTAEQVKVLREALLTYNKPDKAGVCTDLFEYLSNRLRDYNAREENNVDRSTEKS